MGWGSQVVFSSTVFIFCFLPLTLIGYFVTLRLQPRFSFGFLTLASLVFYSYWDVRYTTLLLVLIGTNYALHVQLAQTRSRAVLVAGVSFNLLVLGYFKYLTFIATQWAGLTGWDYVIPQIVLPIGLSFFTFQKIAFLVDTYQGKTGRQKLSDFLLFVTFFPQLIAGPIVHHSEMMPQFHERPDRAIRLAMAGEGVLLFTIGLFKKAVVADPLGAVAAPVFAAADAGQAITIIEAWAAALSYSLQLYFDFSGYADMAIGLGLFFAIRLPINFNSPYKALGIADFWRRWHMTLSRFLRDYLYIPLGGNRKGEARRYLNLFLTMVLGGIWHGAGWGFLIWGIIHGSMISLNHYWEKLVKQPGMGWLGVFALKPVAWPLTLLVVVLAWVPFRAATLHGAGAFYSAMFGIAPLKAPSDFASMPFAGAMRSLGFAFNGSFVNYLSDWQAVAPLFVLAALAALLAPNSTTIATTIIDWFKAGTDRVLTPRFAGARAVAAPVGGVVFGLVFLWATLHLSNVSEFLYFQF